MSARLGVACAAVLAAATAHATVPRTGPRIAADTLTALPAANVTKPLRVAPKVVTLTTPPFAWAKLASTGSWQAAWDAATGVPRQIWGSGIAAPGANADPAIAERVARQVLADQIGLLAPGASIGDFALVSNSQNGDIRSVGFVQRAGGVAVEGGQVSFRFKRDRLFVIASQALPYVTVLQPQLRLARKALVDRASASLRTALALPVAPISAPEADVVLPLIADDGVLGYRLATPMTIDGGADGRYRAYIDPASAGVIAVHQLNAYATGTVLYHGVDRYPGRGRLDEPAVRAHEVVNGGAVTSGDDGSVTFDADSDVTVTTAVDGDLATMINKGSSGGMPATATYTLDPNGQLVWDASSLIENDAQVIAYLSVNQAKAFVRANLDPTLSILDQQLSVNVNIDQDCNAFFDGTDLNFFEISATCENTARISDVVYHEFGHDVHANEIIPGVGLFDSAMSEGVADFLAATITGDHGMGRGFDFTDNPLRDIDPDGMEYKWPQDVGEVHHTGLIFSGSFWDLRKQLISELGTDAGIALTDKLYIGALQRSVDIPSTLVEVLATDDDDGDLSNGTPHECEIRDNWAAHGLRTVTGTLDAPGVLAQTALEVGVGIDLTGLSARCGADAVDHVQLTWKPVYGGTGGTAPIAAASATFYAGQVPLVPDSTMSYKFDVDFADGTTMTLADNRADPWYQTYTGVTVPLYCNNFEGADPFANGWTSGTNDGMPDQWAWSVPTSGVTDPHAAYSGTHVIALAPDDDYRPSQFTWVYTPEIDVGQYSDVRLQYRRWLAVEDHHFDQARITVNGTEVWSNFDSNNGDSSDTQHIDKEWRFQDVQLAGYYIGHKVQIGWDLTADTGLEFGGWTLDDVCIVANPNSICGDGVKSGTEACDDGSANADAPDTCRTYCQEPKCGDYIVDTGEDCDDGALGSVTCSDKCKAIPQSGGCCSAGRGGPTALLGFAAFAVLLRRRRREHRVIAG